MARLPYFSSFTAEKAREKSIQSFLTQSKACMKSTKTKIDKATTRAQTQVIVSVKELYLSFIVDSLLDRKFKVSSSPAGLDADGTKLFNLTITW